MIDQSAMLVRSRLQRAIPLLVILLAIAAMIAMYMGYTQMSLSTLLYDHQQRAVFMQLRLPRVLMAGMVGGSLAVAGAALQALFRNPLAEPFTLGVSGGAALGAAVALSLGLGFSVAGVPVVFISAFLGAGVAIYVVYSLARTGQIVLPGALLLAGVVLNLCASAAVMLLQYITNYTRALQILRWMLGSLDTVGYDILWRMLIFLIPGVALLWWHSRELNLIAIGSDSAATLGVDVSKVERRIYLGCSLIIAVTASVGGTIGFVGLIIPHMVRMIGGQDLRLVLPCSFLGGAAFLMLADAVARTVISPSELPVGILTALLGGPFFLWLMRRDRRLSAI